MNLQNGRGRHIGDPPAFLAFDGDALLPLMRAGFNGPTIEGRTIALLDLRRRISGMVEQMISILDAIDGDTDIEANGDEDEPWLGWSGGGGHGKLDDREEECDGSEPSLGWPEQIDQIERTKIVEGWLAIDGEEECHDEGVLEQDGGSIGGAP